MTAEWKPVDLDPKDVNGDNGEESPIRTVRYVRLRSILMGFIGKSSKYWLFIVARILIQREVGRSDTAFTEGI